MTSSDTRTLEWHGSQPNRGSYNNACLVSINRGNTNRWIAGEKVTLFGSEGQMWRIPVDLSNIILQWGCCQYQKVFGTISYHIISWTQMWDHLRCSSVSPNLEMVQLRGQYSVNSFSLHLIPPPKSIPTFIPNHNSARSVTLVAMSQNHPVNFMAEGEFDPGLITHMRFHISSPFQWLANPGLKFKLCFLC